MAGEVNVQIIVDFPEKGDVPAFRDAIYLPMADYRAMSVSQVEGLRQERYDAWKAHLAEAAEAAANAPDPEPAAPVSSVEQARAILADALAQLDALPADEPAEQPAAEG